MIYEEVRATGNYVVLKAERAEENAETKTEGGIFLAGDSAESHEGQRINDPNGGKVRIKPPKVISIGPGVKKDEIGIDIGDMVIVDDYDMHSVIDESGTVYCLIKATSIKAVIKEKKE